MRPVHSTLSGYRQPNVFRLVAGLLVAALIAPPLSAPLSAPLGAQGRVVARCAPAATNGPHVSSQPEPGGGNAALHAQPCGGQVVRLATTTEVRVEGRIARTRVAQTFENRGGRLGEADFVYPLPRGAALQALKLEIDGNLVSGEVLDARKARATYERIVRAQRDPALAEWAGLGLLRTRIFPFGAGQRRTVVVEYTQLLSREGEALRVTGQLVGSQDPADEQAAGSFRILYDAAELGTPWSPTHAVRVREVRGGAVRDSRVVAGRQEAALTGSAGDVVAYLPIRTNAESPLVTVLTHTAADSTGDRHALVIVAPSRARPAVLPRDVTLALDVSGSMSGRKLEQAVAAGQALLRTLRPTDRLQLLAFSDDVEQYAPELVPATAAAVRRAGDWLNSLEARGGTNIGAALDVALVSRARARAASAAGTRLPRTRLPLTLLITDGQPTVGLPSMAIVDSTAAWLGDTRLFTFGVGADVDATLVEQLAIDGRGTAHFVRPTESVERAVSLVAERLAAPLLANVQVEFDGGRLQQLYAPHGVDLMAGQELVFLARYRGKADGQVRVTGTSGRQPQTTTTAYHFTPEQVTPSQANRGAASPNAESGTAFVPRLWAVQRVAALDAQRRRHGASAELDNEMRELGQRYGVPTPFTSYLVLEPDARRPANARAFRVNGAPAAPTRMRPSAPAPSAPASSASSAKAAGSEVAFESARRAARQRTAVNLSAADAMMAEDARAGAAASVEPTRMVHTLRFTRRDSVWTDNRLLSTDGWKPALTVRVQPFSAAWLALAQAVPELRDIFALGDHIRVRGRTVVVEVTALGVAELSERELADAAARW